VLRLLAADSAAEMRASSAPLTAAAAAAAAAAALCAHHTPVVRAEAFDGGLFGLPPQREVSLHLQGLLPLL
jgi:hypothetical protein